MATFFEVVVTILDYQMKFQLDNAFSSSAEIAKFMGSFGQWCGIRVTVQVLRTICRKTSYELCRTAPRVSGTSGTHSKHGLLECPGQRLVRNAQYIPHFLCDKKQAVHGSTIPRTLHHGETPPPL